MILNHVMSALSKALKGGGGGKRTLNKKGGCFDILRKYYITITIVLYWV